MKTNSIRSIMTKDVICVSPDQKLLDVKHIYEKKNFHHHIPVVDNDKLVGMISLADFMYGIKGAGLDDNIKIYTDLAVKDIMTSNPEYADVNTTIEKLAEILANGKFRAIPILENEKLIGIISTADVIRHYLKQSKTTAL